jgi:DNA-binding MarR family transcriptional regulator
VEREAQRDLEILTELARGELVTQRSLAQRLGMALGLTNLYLKRLARKGYIKITTMPPRRIRYLLTPKGIARKSRLTYEYMEYSVHLYRETRQLLRQGLQPLAECGQRRVAIYDTGEAAELAFLTLRELGLEVTAVFGQDERRGTFVGLPVRPLTDLTASEQDLVIVATFARTDGIIAALTARGLPRDRIVTLRSDRDT